MAEDEWRRNSKRRLSKIRKTSFNVAILWPLSTFTPRRHLDSLAISILWPLSVFTSREDFEKKVLENTETSRYYQERHGHTTILRSVPVLLHEKLFETKFSKIRKLSGVW